MAAKQKVTQPEQTIPLPLIVERPAMLNPYPAINHGADPELFLEIAGQIIGSEKVVPPTPKATTKDQWGYAPRPQRIVRDGVQVELHPAQSTCRASHCEGLKNALIELQALAESKKAKINWDQVVEVSEAEMATLSPEAKKLGCQPSLNFYNANAEIPQGGEYRKRSAGGHIHIGIPKDYIPSSTDGNGSRIPHPVFAVRERLVPLLDIIVGSTCVLLDRNPAQIERRRVYGKAGEYRLPDYGIEYRVLSNFWLRSMPLTSLVHGLARVAVSVLWSSLVTKEELRYFSPDEMKSKLLKNPYCAGYEYFKIPPSYDFEKDLLARADLSIVQRAINENDPEIAEHVWKTVTRPFIEDCLDLPFPSGDGCFSLTSHNLDCFEFFIAKGISHWWPGDIMDNWFRSGASHGGGFEAFMLKEVWPAFRKAKKGMVL